MEIEEASFSRIWRSKKLPTNKILKMKKFEKKISEEILNTEEILRIEEIHRSPLVISELVKLLISKVLTELTVPPSISFSIPTTQLMPGRA